VPRCAIRAAHERGWKTPITVVIVDDRQRELFEVSEAVHPKCSVPNILYGAPAAEATSTEHPGRGKTKEPATRKCWQFHGPCRFLRSGDRKHI
jgi:hypothetical protein